MIVTSECDRSVHRCARLATTPAEMLVSADDAPAIRALLDLTDPVEQHRARTLTSAFVSPEDDYVGPHPEYVLPPFLFPNPSRFSDGSFGILYAALDFSTSAREAAYWLSKPYEDANAPPGLSPRKMYLTMRMVSTSLADARRGSGSKIPEGVYDRDRYEKSRSFGADLLAAGREGVWYESVRASKGECIGAFVPRIVSNAVPQYQVEFEWDGSKFANVKEITFL